VVEVEVEMTPHVSPGRRIISIYLPSDLVAESRRLGLNISRISQNALTDAITKLNGSAHAAAEPTLREMVVGPQGFEPWTPGFPHQLFRRLAPKLATVS